MSGTMIERRPLILDEVPSTHPLYSQLGHERQRSFGFHAPQKERPKKVQHPKPKEAPND